MNNRKMKSDPYLDENMKFYHVNYSKLLHKAHENREELGYIEVFVDDNFCIISLDFIKTKGNSELDNFTLKNLNQGMDPVEFSETYFGYYKILFEKDHSVWKVKDLVVIGQSNDYVKFKNKG